MSLSISTSSGDRLSHSVTTELPFSEGLKGIAKQKKELFLVQESQQKVTRPSQKSVLGALALALQAFGSCPVWVL